MTSLTRDEFIANVDDGGNWSVVVTQLTERSLTTREVAGSNPVFGK